VVLSANGEPQPVSELAIVPILVLNSSFGRLPVAALHRLSASPAYHVLFEKPSPAPIQSARWARRAVGPSGFDPTTI
jgi:hypothetical protein